MMFGYCVTHLIARVVLKYLSTKPELSIAPYTYKIFSVFRFGKYIALGGFAYTTYMHQYWYVNELKKVGIYDYM